MPSKKKTINPDKVFSDDFRKGRISYQRIKKVEWKAYVEKYGDIIYLDKPSVFNMWKPKNKKSLVVKKAYQYTDILEICIYHAGDYIKCKKEEELNKVISVSEEG